MGTKIQLEVGREYRIIGQYPKPLKASAQYVGRDMGVHYFIENDPKNIVLVHDFNLILDNGVISVSPSLDSDRPLILRLENVVDGSGISETIKRLSGGQN